ncbi:MAG: hypothetical protein WC560_12110 [Syntrophales bacterium]
MYLEMTITNLALLSQKNEFIELVIEKLGRLPLDFSEKMQFIRTTGKTNQAAGVLLPLRFREELSEGRVGGEFIFQLIKRSGTVSQPGDLSCPGGLLHRFLDPLLRLFVIGRLLPIIKGNVLKKYAREQDAETFRIMTLFLANASRESWEEIRLSPWNVHFLGPLPAYSLTIFKRTIFPLVGFVKNP